MKQLLHQVAMWLILASSMALFYLTFIWIRRGNAIMSTGMFIMGVVALANFYLHREAMSKKKNKG